MHNFPQALIDGYAAFIRGPYAEAEGSTNASRARASRPLRW